MFARQGYDKTSLREIAEGLGTTKAALYYHFRSKEDLLESIVSPVIAQVDSLLGDRFATDRPRALLAGYLDLALQNRELVRFFASDPSVLRHPGFRAQIEDQRRRFERALGGGSASSLGAQVRAACALGAVERGLQSLLDHEPQAVRGPVLASALAALGAPDRCMHEDDPLAIGGREPCEP